ncbi:MAG: DUF1223 domain-containing protein [Methylocystaceae bacterium]|nr:DUF1223 domain-containing protein [Methylocystaceae bacterium]
MKKLILISAFTLLLTGFTAKAADRLAVVELFTSQGCSSCPPADAFLGELAMRSDVLALAYHVDYWDYIGWKDIHAQAAFTQRQRQYAQTFNLRYIYTPQMVVSGSFETTGTARRSIIQAIETQLSKSHDIYLQSDNKTLTLDGPTQDGAVGVYQVSYHKEVVTEVRRGENRGRTLTDYHIVQDLTKIGQWQGGHMTLALDINALNKEGGHAVFLQRQDNLHIVAALRL